MPNTFRGILLDIEGTTSSVSFVYDVMFPFVRRELEQFLLDKWHDPKVFNACITIANEAGYQYYNDWGKAVGISPNRHMARAGQQLVRDEVLRLMDGDVKATGLKQLQGLIWESGFASGELQAHVYDDVPPTLAAWNAAGIDVRIYSSGSIQAQKLFFGHTIFGNLLPHFRGHYDTTTGPKKEAASYIAIAREFGLPPGEILFCSDVVAELDAARAAGLSTALVVRQGNAAVKEGHGHQVIRSFREIFYPA